MTPTPRQVFLSYTAELDAYPEKTSWVEAARDGVRLAGMNQIDMSAFPAADQVPAELCRERVRAADIWIGIIGFRYGTPVRDEPDRSYLELEYAAATQAGLRRLVFLVSEHASMPRNFFHDAEYGDRQERFRAELAHESGLTWQTVSSPEDLRTKVLHALGAEPRRDEPGGPVPMADPVRHHPPQVLTPQPAASSGGGDRWTKVGAVAAVIGAVAAVLAFAVYRPDGGGVPGAGSTASPTVGTGASRTPSTTPDPVTAATTTASSNRALTSLSPVVGSAEREGNDLTMECATGRSDDQFRELEYRLPGPYSQFRTKVSIAGEGDPEDAASLEVFVRDRTDRADRFPRKASTNIRQDQAVDVSAEIDGASALVLRLTCVTSTMHLTLAEPVLVR